MHLTSTLRKSLVVAAMVSGSAAHAAFDLSTLSLGFANPTGTALATDTIDVMLTFSLRADAGEAFTFDGTAGAPFGVPDILPTQATVYDPVTQTSTNVDFAHYDYAYLNTWYGCSTNFSDNSCPSATTTYRFDWGDLPQALTLNPGESFTYRMGTFTPNGGAAPAGTYTFSYAALALFVQGTDADGNHIGADVNLALTTDQGVLFLSLIHI